MSSVQALATTCYYVAVSEIRFLLMTVDKLLWVASAASNPMMTMECLASDSNFSSMPWLKNVGPLSGSALTRYHEYTAKRSRNNGTIGGTRASPLSAPFCIPCRHDPCVSVTSLLDTGNRGQEIAVCYFRYFVYYPGSYYVGSWHCGV